MFGIKMSVNVEAEVPMMYKNKTICPLHMNVSYDAFLWFKGYAFRNPLRVGCGYLQMKPCEGVCTNASEDELILLTDDFA